MLLAAIGGQTIRQVLSILIGFLSSGVLYYLGVLTGWWFLSWYSIFSPWPGSVALIVWIFVSILINWSAQSDSHVQDEPLQQPEPEQPGSNHETAQPQAFLSIYSGLRRLNSYHSDESTIEKPGDIACSCCVNVTFSIIRTLSLSNYSMPLPTKMK